MQVRPESFSVNCRSHKHRLTLGLSTGARQLELPPDRAACAGLSPAARINVVAA